MYGHFTLSDTPCIKDLMLENSNFAGFSYDNVIQSWLGSNLAKENKNLNIFVDSGLTLKAEMNLKSWWAPTSGEILN